jgi:hypothetical protein
MFYLNGFHKMLFTTNFGITRSDFYFRPSIEIELIGSIPSSLLMALGLSASSYDSTYCGEYIAQME